jgi:hypothetical protein
MGLGKEVKIKVPAQKAQAGVLDTMADFDMLPDIPKLALKLTLDDITHGRDQAKFGDFHQSQNSQLCSKKNLNENSENSQTWASGNAQNQFAQSLQKPGSVGNYNRDKVDEAGSQKRQSDTF